MMDEVLFSQEGHLGLITLNRPQALNALTLGMIEALMAQLQTWASDESVHAVVIQAAGDRAFCAGGDIRRLYDVGKVQDPAKLAFFWHEYRLNYYIHQYPKPYIALMDGITMGGGVGVSLHGSHPVATERFMFAMPETGIGFFPDIGASYLLSRCPGAIGAYLGLTGNRLQAADAHYAGLVKAVVASKDLELLKEKLQQTDLSLDAHQRVSYCLAELMNNFGEPALESQRPEIDECFSMPSVEEIIAALCNHRNPLVETLHQKAPLSLKVTLAQIRKAATMTMAECMLMDYRLVSHFMEGSDFYEGVRALLVDKDKQPKWSPESLAQVMDEQVAGYFEAIGPDLILE